MNQNGTRTSLRLAAVADIHCGKTSPGKLQPVFAQVAERADVLLLCGDLTDYGRLEEAQILAKELTAALRRPVLAVLGNHDFESGQAEEVTRVLCEAGVVLLDGDSTEVDGVGFAGAKGFGGGFGRYALGAWGEEAIKRFVHEAVDEALKLEAALARLRTEQRIVLMHYSPIRETCEGEPPEIFAFLGSSRLEEPINRFQATAVFHGHAHSGSLEGRTSTGIPVYNVAAPLLRHEFPEQPAVRFLDIPLAHPASLDPLQTTPA